MRDLPIYKILTVFFFLMAISLRLLLYAANPPENSFDDHFEPIFLIMNEGKLPPKDACWECFQPPVFYLISAAIGKGFAVTSDTDSAMKLFHFLPFLYGVLNICVIYLILKRVNVSDFARTLAFGMVCFLPRHIYMSAMHTNDTLSYLLVSLCIYLMLAAIDHQLIGANGEFSREQSFHGGDSRLFGPQMKSALLLIALMAAIFLALLTKSTALVLLPVVATIFLVSHTRRMLILGLRSAVLITLLLLVPAAVVGSMALSDMNVYGSPLPLNVELLDVDLRQPPGKEDLSFFDFKPLSTINSPILAPDNISSFWTLIFSRMWFDMEPKFLQFTDPDNDWWDAYDDYLNRHDRHEWPGSISLSPFTRLTGSTLIFIGLVSLLLILIGIARSLFGKWSVWSKTDSFEVLKAQLLLMLLIFTIAGVMFHTFRHPYYSFMKAAFILNALPALAFFLALGLMLGERYKAFPWGISILFGFSFVLTSIHVLDIVRSIGFSLS